MRLLSWNILAGGGSRCSAIVRLLERYEADVIVLQETVPTRAADLCHALRKSGYAHGFSAPRLPGERGLCVLARMPLVRVAEAPPPHARIHPRGWLEVEVVDRGWRIAAVYGPPEGPAVPAFWNAAAAWLPCRTAQPFIMLGDFNAGLSRVDARDYRFKAGRGFSGLEEIGLIDLWRREHGNRKDHTWFSHPGSRNQGRGFRIDHAFASACLARRASSCRYDHRVRQRRLSDHSLLIVDLLEPSLNCRRQSGSK